MSEPRVREVTAEEKKLFLAQAAEAEAAAEASRSEARKNDAEARKAASEAERNDLMIQATKMALKAEAIDLARKQREEAEILALYKYHHIYHFASDVNEISVRDCMHRLNTWDRLEPKCEME